MLPDRACGGHRRANLTQAINQTAFLINAEQRFDAHGFADAVEQSAQLIRRNHVSTEDDDAARLHVFDERAGVGVKLGTGQADVEQLPDLLFQRK
jgi:hypothetical protein